MNAGGSVAAVQPHAIRPMWTLADLQACVRLQEEVWGQGFSEVAPVSLMKASQRLSGLVGGAVDESGQVVGFVFGLTGIEAGRPVHWSHMLAVRSDLRDGGLGRRLKAWQRERCLEMDVRRMYWTFDPLVSQNAWLNLGRLGVVVREYVESMYGVSDSPLHEGLGTDRFVALWLLDDDRVVNRMGDRGAPSPVWGDVSDLPQAFGVVEDDGTVRPGAACPSVWEQGSAVLVPMPADIHHMKARDPRLAAAWRAATREALAPPLSRGWEVRELVRATEALSCYVLYPPGT